MLCVHDKTAGGTIKVSLTVARADNPSTNMTFTFTAVANADARAAAVSSIQRRSSIHIKDTSINGIAIPPAGVIGCGERGRYHGQRAAIASYTITAESTAITVETVTSKIDIGIVQREIDGVDGHSVPATAGDFQRRRSDPDAVTVFTVTLCVDTAGVTVRKVGNLGICIVFKIQITVVLQENAAA